jgi:1,4-alpha-glucan branching enzyme
MIKVAKFKFEQYFENDRYFIETDANGIKSFEGYGIPMAEGKYKVVLNTDAEEFAGFGLSDDTIEHFTSPDEGYLGKGKGWLQLYLPARSALVLQKID